MLSAREIRKLLPAPAQTLHSVDAARAALRNILSGEDQRLIVIVGPCSIHNIDEALTYAQSLKTLADEVSDSCVVLMRTYLEKPRTILGWRGLIADPHLDDSADMAAGVQLARQVLLNINALGLPVATESLDPLAVGYTDDLVSWTALGARTAESQVHRAMASGLGMPVGFKNTTDGRVEVAMDAMATASAAQSYLAPDDDGRVAVQRSAGNTAGHVVLRGGHDGPNYMEHHVQSCARTLRQRSLPERLLIDCSHANSGKQAARQIHVLRDIADQIAAGDTHIAGVMLESNLEPGNQPIGAIDSLRPGVSVTDECLGWEDTHSTITEFVHSIRRTRARTAQRRVA